MATSSFTKNFKLKNSDIEKFVAVMSNKTPKLLKEFKSQYSHPSNYKKKLNEALK